jgi:hypothetical protein
MEKERCSEKPVKFTELHDIDFKCVKAKGMFLKGGGRP